MSLDVLSTDMIPADRPALYDDGDVGYLVGDLTGLLDSAVGLEEMLRRTAEYTALALRGVHGVVLRLTECGADVAVAAGASPTRELDDMQYTLDEGPALEATARGAVISCGALADAAGWPRFGAYASGRGVHSVLSVPLLLPTGPVGTLTAYSAHKYAFAPGDVEIATRFAAPAGAVVHNAYLLEQSRARIAELRACLAHRPVIDQAVGIVISRTGKSATDALRTLRRLSTVERVRLSEVAGEIVKEAARRAYRRRQMSPDL